MSRKKDDRNATTLLYLPGGLDAVNSAVEGDIHKNEIGNWHVFTYSIASSPDAIGPVLHIRNAPVIPAGGVL